MSPMLEQAIAEIHKLPETEQEEIAAWILDELEYERRWAKSFAKLAEKAKNGSTQRPFGLQNPWLRLPNESPFVLSVDQSAIKNHNDKLQDKSPYKIHIKQVIPEPYIGNVTTAPVIILLLNPGYDYRNQKSHSDVAFREALLKNLRHEKTEWPFYFLNPAFSDKLHPGCKWWRSRAKKLIDLVGDQQVSQKLAVIEWFPYKSTKFKSGCKVPSQQYSFELVRQAMARDAVFIIRSNKRWLRTIPELNAYSNALKFKSQNAAITLNNLVAINDEKCDPWQLLLSAFN